MRHLFINVIIVLTHFNVSNYCVVLMSEVLKSVFVLGKLEVSPVVVLKSAINAIQTVARLLVVSDPLTVL